MIIPGKLMKYLEDLFKTAMLQYHKRCFVFLGLMKSRLNNH